MRERLAEIINREAGLTVCGEAKDRHEAIAAIPTKRPDLAIVDLTGSLPFPRRILKWAEFLRAKRAARLSEPPPNPITSNQNRRQTAPLHCHMSSPGSTQGTAENGPGDAPVKKGGPLPRAGRPNRTSHYENQVGALLLAAGLRQFNTRCPYADGGMAPFIQPPAKA